METAETRFDLVVVADLGSATTRAHPLEKEGLDELLAALAPSADLGGAALSFRAFRDFRPDRVAQALPAAASLLGLRALALEAAAGRRTVDELQAALRATPELARLLEEKLPGPPRPAAPAPTGGIFDLVDVEGSAPPAAGLDALLGGILGPRVSIPGPALRAVAEGAEQAAARVVAAALAHPRVRALEAAWRSLRWLLRSVDMRAGCRMHVVSGTDAVRALREVGRPLAAELRSRGGIPVFVVDGSPAAPEEAVAIADAAGGAPVVAGWDLPDAPGPAWAAARKEPATRGLALAAGRFLLRPPYGARGERVKDFAFEEAGEPLWGRASWAVGALAAAGFARTGWAADFTGPSAAEGLEPLPLHAAGDLETPLERDVREPEARALGEAGVLALACRRNADRPFAATGAALHEGVSWRSALFAAQVGTWIERLRGHLDPAAGPEALARTLAAGIELLGQGPDGPALKAEGEPAAGGGPALRLRVRPAGAPLRGLPALELQVPI